MVQPLAAHHRFFYDFALHLQGALALLPLLSLHCPVSHCGMHLMLPAYASHPLPLPCGLLLGVQEDVTVISTTAEHHILLEEVAELLWEPILHIRVLDINALLRLAMQSHPHFHQREVLLVEASGDLYVVQGYHLQIVRKDVRGNSFRLLIGDRLMLRRGPVLPVVFADMLLQAIFLVKGLRTFRALIASQL